MPKPVRRQRRQTQPVFKTLRSLRVLIIHPQDSEGEELIRHVKRIGCQVEATWPIPREIDSRVDVVITLVRQEHYLDLQELFTEERELGPTTIAIVDYENPAVLQVVMDIGAQAVIGKPIRPFGVLTNLILARQTWDLESQLNNKIRKLERQVAGMKKLNHAKALLMKLHGITEEKAYKIIRDQAMSKRATTQEIAQAILNANEILYASSINGKGLKK